MSTCDMCKWWGVAPQRPYSYGNNKVCAHIVRDGDIVYDASVSPIHDNNYLSDLFTGPKFGCVHWESKP